ncbi:hypothetical protein BDV97DRAFT_133495 [Delphinella strobiligena]|nr:hypothetical protein BDV97DRAFT_133495 [Delphinella strobiligena]
MEKASYRERMIAVSTFECPTTQIYANPVTCCTLSNKFNLSNNTFIPMSNTSFLSNTDTKWQERDADDTAPPSRTTTSRRLSWGKRREAIYVYDYSKDKIERIEDGDEFKKQIGKHRQDSSQVTTSKDQPGDEKIKEVPIPLKPGRLPIRVQGPENVAAMVNISAGLRFLRLIRAQNILYVVGSVAPVAH